MTTKDEALKQALDAFLEIEWSNNSKWQADRATAAIQACREALAQQDSEPVAWRYRTPTGWHATTDVAQAGRLLKHCEVEPLYTTPQPAPAVQPMTDDEIEDLRKKTFSTSNPYCPVDSKSMRKAVRAAEAAHGIGAPKE